MVAHTQVRPLPLGVRARLDKLMLMLGSENDTERASAAGMITSLLKEHGLDWHDVVGSIGQPTPQTPAPSAKPSYSPSIQKTMSAGELQLMAHRILRSPINDRSRHFLAGLLDRANIYGSISLSNKQWHWLRDLAKRAGAI